MEYLVNTFRVALKVAELEEPTSVHTSAEACRVLSAIYADLDADQEHVTVLSLNEVNRVIGFKVIASGQMGSSQVDFKLLFRAALALGGSAIVLAHNHLTGSTRPSQDDRNLTAKAKEAAALLGFKLLDHIVLGHGGTYYSFADTATL